VNLRPNWLSVHQRTPGSDRTLPEEILAEDAAVLLLRGLVGVHRRFLGRRGLGKLRRRRRVVVVLLQERFKARAPGAAAVGQEGDERDLLQLQRELTGRRAPLRRQRRGGGRAAGLAGTRPRGLGLHHHQRRDETEGRGFGIPLAAERSGVGAGAGLGVSRVRGAKRRNKLLGQD
jgi:hypothetical protein